MDSLARINALLAVISQQYSAPGLSLKSLSLRFHMSSEHLGRIIVRTTGQSFRQHLVSVRMMHAAAFLQASEHDIKVVAGLVGYRSPSHFAEDFRRTFGVTPKQYKTKTYPYPLNGDRQNYVTGSRISDSDLSCKRF